MKTTLFFTTATALLFSATNLFCQAPGEVFASKRVVNASTAAGRFRQPFAMVMGLNDSLWVTERRGFVVRVNSNNGNKKELLNITAKVKFTTSGSGASLGISQDGMFGIALHPGLNTGTGNDYVYLAYCYDSSANRRVKIVRYQYRKSPVAPYGDTLLNEVVLLKGIPGSNDHNGGRLVIGNYGTTSAPDYKLLYSVGDRGANQFNNACDSIESQWLPTTAQLSAGDLHRYNGKILRLNLDGSIPNNNPKLNGVRSHVWSYGHRNPQGLAFERNTSNELVPGGKLYESEQGPATNDEVNIIDSTNNYGWPRIAGKRDNNWYKYFQWSSSASCSSYGGECSANQTGSGKAEFSFSVPKLTDPIFDLYPGTPTGGTSCNWLTNPTIAPSSIAYYPYYDRIPGWGNCLLITTLKTSSVFRLKLNAAGDGSLSVSDSVVQYFKDNNALNRFRDIVIGNDGITIYVITDSVGSTSGPSGSGGTVTDRGSILEYKYTGAVLAIGTDPVRPTSSLLNFKMYPNPATSKLFVDSKRNMAKPLRYQLFDASGRPVLTGSSSTDRFEINVAGLLKGMYIIKVTNAYDITVATEKIIVN